MGAAVSVLVDVSVDGGISVTAGGASEGKMRRTNIPPITRTARMVTESKNIKNTDRKAFNPPPELCLLF
jgi:hypothetical protein